MTELDIHTMNLELEHQVRAKFAVPEDARLGWHFCGSDKRLAFDDNRLIRVGHTLKVKGTPSICRYGLHASPTIQDAIDYLDCILCLVWVRGEMDSMDSKFCGKERHCLAMLDEAAFDTILMPMQRRIETLRFQYDTRCKTIIDMFIEDYINIDEYHERVAPHNKWYLEQLQIICDKATEAILQLMGIIE